MDYEQILYQVERPVATITLNRVEAMNAISPQLETELHEALDEADADSGVRVVILTGSGRAFCSGYDMSGGGRPGESRLDPTGKSLDEYLATWQKGDTLSVEKLLHLWRLQKPIIAAVNGWAMGGGFWYQLACDITIASDRAVFAQPEVRHVSNSTFLFAALCGWKAANRFALTGDHMDAAEALRVGLVNEVVPHEDLGRRARAIAERIAMVPEASVRLNKAITMQGLLASGVYAGLIPNGPLSALAHASHGPDRDRLFEAQKTGGMRGFLDARDGPFLPEPFGPKAGASSKSGERARRAP
jgi:enoyl-CoA hydratase/carnithine racemase